MIGLQEYEINKGLLFRDKECLQELLKLIHNTMVVDFMAGSNDIGRSKKALIDEINEGLEEYITEINSSTIVDILPDNK